MGSAGGLSDRVCNDGPQYHSVPLAVNEVRATTPLSSRLLQMGRRLPESWRGPLRKVVFGASDRRRKEVRFRGHLRPTDGFIVAHPKSGNTWIAYMLAILLEHGDPEHRVTTKNLGAFVPTIHGDDAGISAHEALPDPRIFRNEWPDYPALYPRTVYLVRDPRSVLVSYFHHYRVTTGDTKTSLDDFIELYLREGCIRSWEPRLTRWDRQVAEWKNLERTDSVMIVKYEDMHADRQAVLKQIASFCRIPPSRDAIDAAVERGSFEEMRFAEQQHGAEAYPQEPGSAGWFLRRGRVDAWKDELTPQTRTAIEEEFRPVMEALGYTLDSES